MTRRRLPLLTLAPMFAVIALLAWVFASPIGAGPDDDYHLISTWCAGPTAGDTCAEAEAGGTQHQIPVELADISCYAGYSEQSAACQAGVFDGDLDETVTSSRGNFAGEYPPLYYAIMGLFTSADIQTSALAMRVFTVVLFVGIMTALYLLLPVGRRPTLIVGWLVTTVPLGIFLLASNNPSAWATIGVGTSWIALLGYFETVGRPRIALGGIYAVGVIMAAGSRGDAALYAGLATVLVLVYVFQKHRGFLLASILPVVMGLVALAFLLASRQAGAGIDGFSGGNGDDAVGGQVEPEPVAQDLSGFGRLAYNLLNVPLIWAGSLGEWGLGWLDTSMPAVVTFGAIAAFVAAGLMGIGKMTVRKAVVVGVLVFVLWALPVFVLQQGGGIVGEQVQPRYLLPLVVLLGGMLALAKPGTSIQWTRTQRRVVASSLAIAHFVALHMNIRRYVTGVEGAGFNLDAEIEWWWTAPFSPMFVWIVGSLAYGALVFLVAERMISPAVATAAPTAVATAGPAAVQSAEPTPITR